MPNRTLSLAAAALAAWLAATSASAQPPPSAAAEIGIVPQTPPTPPHEPMYVWPSPLPDPEHTALEKSSMA